MKTFSDGLEFFSKQEHFTNKQSTIEEMRSDFMLLIRISRQNKGFLCESDFEDAYCSASEIHELDHSYEEEEEEEA